MGDAGTCEQKEDQQHKAQVISQVISFPRRLRPARTGWTPADRLQNRWYKVEGDPGRRLSVNSIRRIIRSRAAAVDIEGRVSGHSFRVGGAQSLAAGGASISNARMSARISSNMRSGWGL